MWQEISLRNFKAFQEVELRPGLITVFIGPNGAGKSTVLHALALLKQSMEQPNLILNERFFQAGSFNDLLRRGGGPELEVGLKLAVEARMEPLSHAKKCTLDYTAKFAGEGLKEQAVSIRFSGLPGVDSLSFTTPEKPRHWRIDPECIELPGRPKVTFYGSYLIGLPFQFKVQGVDKAVHNKVQEIRHKIVDSVSKVHIVPAERVRVLTSSEYMRLDKRVPVNELCTQEEMINYLADEWVLQDDVSEWLERIVGRRIRCEMAAETIIVQASAQRRRLPIANEGAGTRQLIWPLAVLSGAAPGSMIAIEEPEIHLHPRAHAEFCNVLVEVVKEKDKQLILTCHNEHILMSLLTSVAEGKLKPKELAIYYFEEEDGAARATRLPVDDKGALEGGLRGFFEADMEELTRRLKALAQRGGK